MKKKPAGETRESPVGKKLWREAIIASRFGLVGITATAVHMLAVSVLLSETQLPTLLANACAFLVAFCVSFAGNYVWTFQLPGEAC
jgi:putative flippase GtrA